MEKTYKHICKDGREITLYPFFATRRDDEIWAVYALKKNKRLTRFFTCSALPFTSDIRVFEEDFFGENGEIIIYPISASEFTLNVMGAFNGLIESIFSDLAYEDYGKE